jgi:hypothetical protein
MRGKKMNLTEEELKDFDLNLRVTI